MHDQEQIRALSQSWANDSRWKGIQRPYRAEDVLRLRGSVQIEYTLARMGAEKLWRLLEREPYLRALGAVTGNQAVEQVQAGLRAIYVSGWQVAGDMNTAGQMYPDQSLYPVDSAPDLIRRINQALVRADQIQHMEGRREIDWFVPIIADGEAGFGGPLNTFELTKAMIEAGAAAVHLEDQLSSLKKCGHMGGKVLVPASEFIPKLVSARLAADVLGVPALIVARTDAEDATLIRSDFDAIDQRFLTGTRTVEGFFGIKNGTELSITRALAYAPYADMLWCETAKPDLGQAREFAQGVHAQYPGKWLAYNCSPSFNWKLHLDEKEMRTFQDKLAEMGYKFQFVTLAGFHALNASMFALAHAYQEEGMAAYSRLQEQEFQLERDYGYRAVKHQSFVGAGYFDAVQLTVQGGDVSTSALKGSTEEQQFHVSAKT